MAGPGFRCGIGGARHRRQGREPGLAARVIPGGGLGTPAKPAEHARSIPSPVSNGLRVGPFVPHAYGLAYALAVMAAVAIAAGRWEALGRQRGLVREVAL